MHRSIFGGRAKASAGSGRDERVRLVASGLGDDTGGGVFVVSDGEVSAIDSISTTGLAVSADGSRLARLTWTDDQPDSAAQVLVYDRRGLVASHRVNELREPHSVLWEGERLVAVSTHTNTILWIDPAGTIVKLWRAPGEGDSWHLNSLTTHRGRLLVSAFGRFGEHRDWADSAVRAGRGIVVDVRSGREVLTGLSAPHNPQWMDGGWLVCNSDEGKLLRLDGGGRVLAQCSFPGWTRGLAADHTHLYLGVSAHRLRGAESGRAFVVALTRDGLEETQRWSLPSREVYDVAIVPEALSSGLCAGASVNRLGDTGQQISVTFEGSDARGQ